jgi:hypothetical protein
VTRGAARLLIDLGYAPLAEVTLPNGRRADLMALGPKGDILIVEVKSGLEDFRVDRKWGEYMRPIATPSISPSRRSFPDGDPAGRAGPADRRRRLRRRGVREAPLRPWRRRVARP